MFTGLTWSKEGESDVDGELHSDAHRSDECNRGDGVEFDACPAHEASQLDRHHWKSTFRILIHRNDTSWARLSSNRFLENYT